MSRGAPDCTVRPATPADLMALCALEAAASSAPWSRGQLGESLVKHRVLLAEVAGQVLGYAVFRELLDEAELLNIAVAPEVRRRGIGRRLLGTLLTALAPAARCLYLEVRAGNAAAIALYDRLGFTRVGCRRGYYPAGDGREDALLMRLDLDGFDGRSLATDGV